MTTPPPTRPRLETTRAPGVGPGCAILGGLAGARIAELGCGAGHNLAHLVARHHAIGVGIDNNPDALARARHAYRRLPGLTLTQTDAADYLRGQPAGCLDACLSIFGAFSFTPDPAALLAAAAHALRPGGRLLVSLRADQRRDRVILLTRR